MSASVALLPLPLRNAESGESTACSVVAEMLLQAFADLITRNDIRESANRNDSGAGGEREDMTAGEQDRLLI